MIGIYINGKQAFIKKDSSFEFVRENNLFDSSDGFTFEMEFPLKGCPQNQEAFGYLHLPIVDKPTELMPCVIQSGRLRLTGSIAVMSADESAIKAQFLEGVDVDESEELLENTYINELDLGKYPQKDSSKVSIYEKFNNDYDAVCLTWYNEEYDAYNNKAKVYYGSQGAMIGWDEETKYLCWQPLFLNIIRKVAEEVGFNIDSSFDSWIDKNSHWKEAYICNTLPATWQMDEYADALPAWSVIEFFEQCGLLFGGKFKFNYVDKSIEFESFEEQRNKAGVITIDKVVRDYAATVSRDEEDASYAPIIGLKYKDSDATIWKYWCCPEFMKNQLENFKEQILTYDSWEEALPNIKYFTDYMKFNRRSDFPKNIIYIKNLDTYFIMRANFTNPKSLGIESSNKDFALFAQMTPLNIFGVDPLSYDENASYKELAIVPAIVDWTDEGQMLILEVGSDDSDESNFPDDGSFEWGEGSSVNNPMGGVSFWCTNNPSFMTQSWKGHAIERDDESKSEYYDRIYIGFRNNTNWVADYFTNQRVPMADMEVWITTLWQSNMNKMRLANIGTVGARNIDPKVMYEFSFLAEEIPNINAEFLINGKSFVCKKLNASFSEKGMSKIIKGEFYRIKD